MSDDNVVEQTHVTVVTTEETNAAQPMQTSRDMLLRDHGEHTTSSWKDLFEVVMQGYRLDDVDFLLDIYYVAPRSDSLTHSIMSVLADRNKFCTYHLAKSIDNVDRYFVKKNKPDVTDGRIFTNTQKAIEGKPVDFVLMRYVRDDPIIFNEGVEDEEI